MTAYDGLPVAVAGAGARGLEVAGVLRDLGARVTVVDASTEDRETAAQQGFSAGTALPDELGLLVTASESRPSSPLLVEAASRAVEVIGDAELAWRLRAADAPPWLLLTGTQGTATAAAMLTAILEAAGCATGSGTLLERVLSSRPLGALVVPVTSLQLHWSTTIRPHTGCLLNLSDGRSEWHGSFQAYALAKGKAFDADTSIGFADDEVVRTLQNRARGRRVSFTLRSPRPGELGVVEDLLVDRAYPDVPGEATELATLADVLLPGDHQVGYALAAAAVARSFGVPATAVSKGLRTVLVDPT